MQKIKVLRIINRFNIGGPTFHVTLLTKYLGDEFETLLVGGVPDEGESDSLHVLREYELEPLVLDELQRNPNFTSDRKAYKKLKQIIREFQPDIVHTHAAKAGALGRRAALKCGVPIILHTFHGHVFHSYFGSIKTGLFKQIEKGLAKKTTGIIAISEQQKQELAFKHRICKPEKIRVIPLGLDLNKFNSNKEENRLTMRKTLALADGDIAIAIIGRLAPIKDHSFFLSAIDALKTITNRSIKVFIIGDGSERATIEERCACLNEKYGFFIKMTSWIEDVVPVYHAMDIVCLSSKNEGTPVTLIEAQASGVPVVSTDVGGVKEIIKHGDTGFVVARNDKSAYVSYLLSLVEKDELRKAMACKGWDSVGEKYSYPTLIKNITEYYKELMQKI